MSKDVVIVGAGILGLSTAYHIKRKNPGCDVVIIEKGPSPGCGNTSKSWACFRDFFTSSTNRALAVSSIDFYKHVQEELEIDIQMDFLGYFFLMDNTRYKKMEKSLKDLAAKGVGYKTYDAKEIESKFEMVLNPSGERADLLGLTEIDLGVMITRAGSIDSDSIVRFYESEFLKLGGEIKYNTRVNKILVEPKKSLGYPNEPYFWQDQRVSGVETDKGSIKTKKTIIATGAWAHELLNPIGVDSYCIPEKKHEFVVGADTPELQKLLQTPGLNPANMLPYVIVDCMPQNDISLHILPKPREGNFWLGGGIPRFGEYILEENPIADKTIYEFGLNWMLKEYFPQFENARITNSWGAQYALNNFDGQPVIFEKHDLIVVGAASGSGVMKADAIGRMTASLYQGEKETELYNNQTIKVSDLGIENRRIEYEEIVL
jgi:glycine/D-amino acid oxidase-like deaminating enzyme